MRIQGLPQSLVLTLLVPLVACGGSDGDGSSDADSTAGDDSDDSDDGGQNFDVCAALPENMKCIESNTFTMGSDLYPSETLPLREVTLDAYWIDTFETSADEYRECVDAGDCTAPSGTSCTYDDPNLGTHPVNCVNHNQATDYCAFRGKRLLTEAEWENASGADGQR
ncbi:MAG: formylglycine-generating enzyme family protein, partial [Nannocystaceae bacterium]